MILCCEFFNLNFSFLLFSGFSHFIISRSIFTHRICMTFSRSYFRSSISLSKFTFLLEKPNKLKDLFFGCYYSGLIHSLFSFLEFLTNFSNYHKNFGQTQKSGNWALGSGPHQGCNHMGSALRLVFGDFWVDYHHLLTLLSFLAWLCPTFAWAQLMIFNSSWLLTLLIYPEGRFSLLTLIKPFTCCGYTYLLNFLFNCSSFVTFLPSSWTFKYILVFLFVHVLLSLSSAHSTSLFIHTYNTYIASIISFNSSLKLVHYSSSYFAVFHYQQLLF